jgi:tetratricopeptide (TPR) repeat protein
MYQEAIESYKQAIRIDPRSSQAHYALGAAYRKTGRMKRQAKFEARQEAKRK